MTMTKHETEITADPTVPLVRIVREFDAPAAKVFKAHTDRDLVIQWNGPNGLEMEIETWDCRKGGSYRYVHRQDGAEHWFHGCFHDVVPNEVIVQTFTYEGFPEGVALERLVLEDLDGGRCRLTATSLVDSFEGRDAFLSSGMEVGVNEGYQRLDALLA
jgi:uncharacterized protein YndB with AHSA1/START domain